MISIGPVISRKLFLLFCGFPQRLIVLFAFSEWLRWLQWFSFDLIAVDTSMCSLHINYYSRFVIIMMLPIVIILLIALVAIIRRITIDRALQWERTKKTCLHIITVMLFFMYPSLTRR
jgi:hypothetical protein